jgi:hypothetical protein
MESPEGLMPPSPDRLTAADRDRLRDACAAAAARHAMLVASAPWWRRALAALPDTQRPLRVWVAEAKMRMRNRL